METKYVYIVDYDLKRKFGHNNQTPVCVYQTYEAAKRRVDDIFEEQTAQMQAALTDGYTFEFNGQEWPEEDIRGDKEGYCYTCQCLSKCEEAYRIFGDEVADDLQVSVIKIEMHEE